MKIVFYIFLFFNLHHIALSQDAEDEDDIDVVVFSVTDNQKVVTASGPAEIGKKLGNVTLERFSNSPKQKWTLININSGDDTFELIAKENEQNTFTSYLHKGAHSHNQWKISITETKGESHFELRNQRNSKCLNNMNGKLFYSVCDGSSSQKWILKRTD